MSKYLRLAAAALTAALTGLGVIGLTACGGGGGGGDSTQGMQTQEQLASASVPGLMAFTKDVIDTQTSESSDPRSLDAIVPPVSDSAEPWVFQ